MSSSTGAIELPEFLAGRRVDAHSVHGPMSPPGSNAAKSTIPVAATDQSGSARRQWRSLS